MLHTFGLTDNNKGANQYKREDSIIKSYVVACINDPSSEPFVKIYGIITIQAMFWILSVVTNNSIKWK